MALTPAHSSQYLTSRAVPQRYVAPVDWGATLKVSRADYAFPPGPGLPGGMDGGLGTAKLITLPAGRKYLYPNLCRIVCSTRGNQTPGSDGHLGHSGWTTPAGVVVPPDDNAFMDNIDLGAFPFPTEIDTAWILPTSAAARTPFVIDSVQPVDIEFMIDTNNGPVAGVSPSDQFLRVLVVWADGE